MQEIQDAGAAEKKLIEKKNLKKKEIDKVKKGEGESK